MARRALSLRGRGYLAVVGVVLLPFVVVGLAAAFDEGERARMEARAEAAAEGARALLEAGSAGDAALDAVARREGVRLFVLDAGGRVALDRDHDPETSLRDRVGDLFFGPEGAPALRAYDDALPPLPQRAEIAAALRAGADRGCTVVLGGKLLVCHASRAAAGGAVLAEKSSPRAIRALWDVRGPMLKLTLYVLFMALALAAWLGRAIVRPIERLRGEVLARSRAPLAGDPIHGAPRDEIGDLAAAFNVLLGAIAEKSRQNHAFMADLVHELKSPVAAVRAAAEALGEGPADEARARRLARALAESGRRLDGLVSEFLELSRAEAGLPNEERAPVDVGALAQALCASMRDDERHAGVRFEVDASAALVDGVAARMERAIGNVLDNAAGFAGAGGAVRVTVRAEGGACVVAIGDTGPGIAAEKLPRIFERFFTDRADGRGTGLGLALTKAIVEAHGGSVSAASPPGGGAVISLRLPVVSPRVHTPDGDVSPPA